ncbi:MAG: hypothetical protein IKW20_01375 [Bacteroidales bacterium]|nr:hypothetical protein [Bacteroidales bacterium]
MKQIKLTGLLIGAMLLAISCENVDTNPRNKDDDGSIHIELEQVAAILSAIELQSEQLLEVHDAVSSSSTNGYDEEYTMRHLFENPGSGVGEITSKSSRRYSTPLRDLISNQVKTMTATKAVGVDADAFLDALSSSDMQIYWPFSDDWDGKTMPVITFDPEDGSQNNIGYRFVSDDSGRHWEEVVVDEEFAMTEPVWVVNRNSDAGYTSLEMMRREDPQWGEGGGAIIVKPMGKQPSKAPQTVSRALVLRDFTMKRNYDTWFAGASEFFIKIGYLDNFTASTEAELQIFNPLVTDCMVVVKRRNLGVPQQMNVMLMTDWSPQMTSSAFMISEDDGGTQTEWTCKAKVFIESKSYGVEINLPIRTKDDVVWRGELSNRWIEENNNRTWAFGDVDLTFELLEY